MNNVNPHQYLQDADLLYSEQEVLRAIHTLAKAITAHYENECPIVLSVMNGALVFAGQLIPNLAFPLQLDYIHATRYQGDVEGKNVTWLARPSINVKDIYLPSML